MKAMVLTAALIVAASPALASSGRIACQQEVRDVVQRLRAENVPMSRELTERIQVINNQCRFASGLAEASLDGLRNSLGVPPGPQAAYQPPADESLDAYD